MRAWVWLAPLVLLLGCVVPVNLRYQPGVPSTVIENSKNLKIFVAAPRGPQRVRSGGFVGWQYSIAPSPPLTASVEEALRLELGRLGVSVADSPGRSDGTLQSTINDVSVSWGPGFAVAVDSLVDLSMVLADRQGISVWRSTLQGHGQARAFAAGFPGEAPSQSLNAALAEAVASFGARFAREHALDNLTGPPPAVVDRLPFETVARADISDIIDEAPPAASAQPKAYALVIGVRRYRRKLPDADFADADAQLVAKYLRALGYPDLGVATLINDEASKGDFEKYFERWLPNHAETGSEVFVYYSGHGAPDPKTGDAYLVPYDADPTYIAETGYPLKKMYEQLAKLPAKRITVVMDSCFSGAGGRSVIAAGARPLVNVVQDEVPANITVVSASAVDQISNTYQEKGHGLFTYYFLKGLKEKGDDLRAVYDYLKPEVSGYARRELNADQVPQWLGRR